MTALGADPLKNGTIFEYEPDRKHYLYQPLVDNPADPNEPIRNELVSARDVEDSNLALASLGRFANAYGFTPNQTKDALPQDPSKIIRTPITPDSIVAQAKLAYQGSGSVIFDLHLGTSNVWNQSIEHMVDVSYDEVDRSQLGQYIGSQDLVASPESAGMVEQIKEAEADLEYMSLHDRRRPIPYSQPDGRHPSEPQVSPYLLKLRALVQSSSSSAPANESMLEQVHELKAIEQKLLDAGKVSSDPNKKFIKHRIFVKYTNEAKAGVNGDVPSGVMSLEYLSVVNSADGSTRSSWLPPPTEKLSQICSDASKPGFDPNTVLGARVVENERSSAKLKKYSSYGLVEYIDPKLDSICAGNTSGNCAQSLHAQCAELQKGPSFDREVAIGVFPPKRVKVNYSSDRPCYTAGDPNRTKACEFLLNKLATCDSGRKFSKVSKFVKDARAAVSGNSIEQSLPLLEQDYIAAHEAGGLSLDDFKTNAYLLKDVRELGAANARAAGETDPARIAQASQAAVDTVLKPLYDWISHN